MDDNAGGHLRSHIVLMHWWNLSHLGKVSTPNGPTLWLGVCVCVVVVVVGSIISQ